jgi:hypothetical protein
LETTIVEEGHREYARVYMDGSVMDEWSGCAIVMGQREMKIRLPRGNKDHKKIGSGQTHRND